MKKALRQAQGDIGQGELVEPLSFLNNSSP